MSLLTIGCSKFEQNDFFDWTPDTPFITLFYYMITLDDNLWKELKGGHQMTFDVSVPLKRLEATKDKKEIENIYRELWNELHHQGNVGLASYMAVPQMVRIAKERNLFNWNVLALCATIEQQRHLGQNPTLPMLYEDYYQNGLTELKKFVVDNIRPIKDEITFRSALSVLAACNGYAKLSKAIIEMSNDVLDEFLEQY